MRPGKEGTHFRLEMKILLAADTHRTCEPVGKVLGFTEVKIAWLLGDVRLSLNSLVSSSRALTFEVVCFFPAGFFTLLATAMLNA